VIDKKREIIFFVLSCVLHACLAYWILHAQMRVKVFAPQKEITEVTIVTNGRLRLPEMKPTTKTASPSPSTAIPPAPPAPEVPVSEYDKTSASSGGIGYFKTEPLNLSAQQESDAPFRVNLDLSLRENARENLDFKKILQDLEVEDRVPYTNLARHLFPSPLPGQPIGGTESTVAGSSGMLFSIKSFDITPWARRVIHRVDNHWTIPLALKIGASGIVGVRATYNKKGELLDSVIEQHAEHHSLDQAALEAVKRSAPLPSLPDDFPDENVEAYFVFEYGI